MAGMKFDLGGKVNAVLREESEKNPGIKLDALEIGKLIVEKYPEDAKKKIDRSRNENLTYEKLPEQLRSEILAHYKKYLKNHSKLKIDVSTRPRLFYYGQTEIDNEETKIISNVATSVSPIITEEEKSDYTEESLYTLLQQYLYNNSGYRIYSLPIPHHGSHGKGANANEWLHPDVVGFEDVREKYEENEMQEFIDKLSYTKLKFWSFEVKKIISPSNIRRAFFQTVANSSWANFTYLVATEVTSDEAEEELRKLSNLHGVGFIKLNKEVPSESQIQIPAKEKKDVDWDAFSLLLKNNKKFENDFAPEVNNIINVKGRKFNLKKWGIKEVSSD